MFGLFRKLFTDEETGRTALRWLWKTAIGAGAIYAAGSPDLEPLTKAVLVTIGGGAVALPSAPATK
jgi:hypothetical protein